MLALMAAANNPYDSALALAGLTKETALFDKNILRYYDFDEFVLGSFDMFWESPWRIPDNTLVLGKFASAGIPKASEGVMSGGRLVGLGIRRTLLGDPTAGFSGEGDLASAVAEVDKAAGGPGDKSKFGGEVPADVVKAVLPVLRATIPAMEARRVSFTVAGGVGEAWTILTKTDESAATIDAETRLARDVDLRTMASASIDLMIVCEKAMDALKKVDANFHFEVETAAGWIALNGKSADTYAKKPYLLIVDTGGNDTYYGGATTMDAAHGISIILDTHGDDKYLSRPGLATASIAESADRKDSGPGIGGALCGVSLLYDVEGNDLYRTTGWSQGSATYGLAVVWDGAGDDVYDAYSRSQGCALKGIGMLIDSVGKDRYQCFGLSQGCGLLLGYGALVDGAGDDKYVANDTVIDDPSAQSKEHNTSMAQGAGFGRRADFSDGYSQGGGIGVLYDGGGDDEYSCGVFGQGVGYWKGVGALIDAGGNDAYKGVWYVQGAAAHFSIGILHDAAGNDTYQATMNMAQGAGHDFSIGFLIDDAGNDKHSAPNLSLGGGNANGMGVFIDLGGDDVYESSGITLGKSSANDPADLIRGHALCLGVFIDLGGTDTYPAAAPWAKNGVELPNWTTQRDKPSESSVGVFVDK